MKKLLVVTLILSILFATAYSNVSFSDDAHNNEKSVEKISFDLTYQELLQKFIYNNFQFSEIEEKSFDNNEKLVSGVIYMSDSELEICRVKREKQL